MEDFIQQSGQLASRRIQRALFLLLVQSREATRRFIDYAKPDDHHHPTRVRSGGGPRSDRPTFADLDHHGPLAAALGALTGRTQLEPDARLRLPPLPAAARC